MLRPEMMSELLEMIEVTFDMKSDRFSELRAFDPANEKEHAFDETEFRRKRTDLP
jgi:hypothetical protein